jgi:hypothetical protein
MEVSGQLHDPAALLSPEKGLKVLLDRKQGGPHSWSGRCKEDKNSALPGIEPEPSSP